MDNLLLEKIIKEKKTEELARLNAITIVDKLFAELMDREKDVLSRRFGLYGNDKHTLEEIGTIHKLTRERVRQIEAASIKKLKKIEKLEEYISGLKNSIDSIVKEHGGFVRKEYLLDIMTVLSHDLNGDHTDSTYKNHVDFIVSKILDDQFDRIDNSEYFNSYFKVKDHETAHFENIAKELVNKVDDFKKTLTTEELLDLVKRLESYDKNQGEINKYGSNLDLTDIFKSEVFPDKGELINENKITYSLLQAIKNIEQNRFGHWGIAEWQEVKPKTINDKIYLILKNSGQPMHFTEIAEKINEIGFDKKKANPATVHNELILDERYVLTGRGTYALKEWAKA